MALIADLHLRRLAVVTNLRSGGVNSRVVLCVEGKVGDASDLLRVRGRYVGERLRPHRAVSLHGEVDVRSVFHAALARRLGHPHRRHPRHYEKIFAGPTKS